MHLSTTTLLHMVATNSIACALLIVANSAHGFLITSALRNKAVEQSLFVAIILNSISSPLKVAALSILVQMIHSLTLKIIFTTFAIYHSNIFLAFCLNDFYEAKSIINTGIMFKSSRIPIFWVYLKWVFRSQAKVWLLTTVYFLTDDAIFYVMRGQQHVGIWA